MFASTKRTRSTLLEGPPELTKPFIFEAAIHFAEEGERVVYITPNPLESLPSTYHDRTDILPESFKLVRFLYPENYNSLISKLVDLENCRPLPSVLLIDDLDAYVRDADEIRANALFALIRDSTNACARILDSSVCLCIAADSTSNFIRREYFEEAWRLNLLGEDDGATSLLRLCRIKKTGDEDAARDVAFDYQRLDDGGLVLKQLWKILVRAATGTEVVNSRRVCDVSRRERTTENGRGWLARSPCDLRSRRNQYHVDFPTNCHQLVEK